jgi:sulfite exporter TauE/SafE
VTALALTVLLASLLGSMHCMGMCGGFVAFWAGSDQSSGSSRTLGHVAYGGGRLLVYSTLGLIAGSIGAAVDLAGSAAGLQRSAAVVAGATMVVWGLFTLAQVLGVRVPRLPLPAALRALTTRAYRSLRGRPPVVRALAMGLLTAILPCGWLYAFVVTAAGTGGALAGAFVMTAFWLGTLPVMVGLGVGLQALAGPLRRHLPAVSAVAIVVVGLLSVTGRIGATAHAAPMPVASDVDEAKERVRALDPDEQCCHDDD